MSINDCTYSPINVGGTVTFLGGICILGIVPPGI